MISISIYNSVNCVNSPRSQITSDYRTCPYNKLRANLKYPIFITRFVEKSFQLKICPLNSLHEEI